MKSLEALFIPVNRIDTSRQTMVCESSLHRATLKFSVVALFAVAVALAGAQSPNDGRVDGGAYLNSYFRVSYLWPQILQPMDTRQLKTQPPASSTTEFLLFTAREGSKPFGVVLMAEKPSFHAQRSDGLNESRTFLEQVKKWWDPSGNPKVLQEMHSTNADGLTFYELDYTIFGEYSAAIATQIGEFQLVFRCNASSAPDLAQMTKSALETRRIR
jgi:hypothetical protein